MKKFKNQLERSTLRGYYDISPIKFEMPLQGLDLEAGVNQFIGKYANLTVLGSLKKIRVYSQKNIISVI